MKDEDYKPFYLNDIVEINEGYYILNGFPQYDFNEDLHYELHIQSNNPLKIIEYYIDDWIYVDLISSSELEIWTGEFESERCSDGSITYTNYSYKMIEKTSKDEWKPKVKDLEVKFNSLLHERLPAYTLTRNKVADNFKRIYKEVFPDDNNTENAHNFLFRSLYGFPQHNLVHEAYLHSLVNPNKKLILFKDWKLDYQLLEIKYNNLLDIDLEDYDIIKKHVIDIYQNMFSHMLPNLKYQFKDVDEKKHTVLFDSIIKVLDKTEF
ncbi:hypothetical protein AAFN85_27705 [Mucilaginibacter sp. CAU 1740]|uniref:hypothetical protein n=1 Tax=Mucilaginibacter sp. CAU 1740 TaxID=3140365 RepID=UPI00325C056E